jgi:hypothetical protein
VFCVSKQLLVFVNPCVGQVDKDPDGKPVVCNPLQEDSCRDGYFCLSGDISLVNNSFCCPMVSSK